MGVTDETVCGQEGGHLVCSIKPNYMFAELPEFIQFVRIYVDSALHLKSSFIV